MKKSEAIKLALDMVEVCKTYVACDGCPYRVKHGKFKDHCMVGTFNVTSSPNEWLINEMLGDDVYD